MTNMESKRTAIVLLTLCSLLNTALCDDPECTDFNHLTYGKTGRCIKTSDCYGNTYISNKCPSYDYSIKCCFAPTHACDSYYHPTYGTTGKCMSSSLCPGGTSGYITGKCPGASNIICCFSDGSTPVTDPCNQFTTVTRSNWNANAPTGTVGTISSAVDYVFIHHTDGYECFDTIECGARMRGIQNYHQNSRGYSDIGYSFLVGSDGKIYEGRGWGKEGAHTQGYNSVGYAFSFMGKFTSKLPTPAALKAVQNAIACGVQLGHIKSDYELRGHRDVGTTTCPGDLFYNKVVKKWPNY